MIDHDFTYIEAMSLVLKCGVPPELSGCNFLADAVVLRTTRNTPAMKIYRSIADKRHIKPKSVIRDIAYALSKCDDLHVSLSRLLGFPVYEQLSNNLVISYLSVKLDSILSHSEDMSIEL